MVAYSFMKRFAEKVESGIKPHTIRDNHNNGRHAKDGDKLQLYTGMRTKQCRKLMDTLCLGTWEIDIRDSNVRILSNIGWSRLSPDEVEALAIGDGFDSVAEFFEYFREPADRVLVVWSVPEWLKAFLSGEA